MILPASFYSRSTLEVLEDLIGLVLVCRSDEGLASGIIVEAEAYRGEDDPASYAFKGKTKRSEMLYGPPGRAFVCLTYGMHYLLNVVTEREGFPAGILIRALQPLEGLTLMMRRRHTEKILQLCSGPAKLCQALDVDYRLNGASLVSSASSLFIREKEGKGRGYLVWKPRVGIRQGEEKLWRAYLEGNPYVSLK